jgi:signal transduction histidine kinase
MAQVALVCVEASEVDEAFLEEVATAEGVQLVRASKDSLHTALLAGLARGGVVYVARTSRDANRALGLGADEVVRVGHLSRASITRAIKRAGVRADSRTSRVDLELRTRVDVASVLSMLASVLGHEMNTPLSIASLTCEALTEGLPSMLDVQERLIGWATLAAPKPEFGRLMTTLAQQPSPSEYRVMLADLRDGIDRATRIAHLLRRLTSEEPEPGHAHAAATLEDVHELLRSQLGRDGAIRVDVDGPCVVRVGRPTLVLLIAALLAHAIDAVREAAPGDASVRVQASEQEDVVLIEIAHDGRPIPTDLRPSVLEPYFALASGRAASELSVEGLQKRARLLGGELLVLREGKTTTLRLALPSVEAQLGSNPQPSEPAPESVKRRAD